MARRRERLLTEINKLLLQGNLVDLDTVKQLHATHGVPFKSSWNCILFAFLSKKKNKSNDTSLCKAKFLSNRQWRSSSFDSWDSFISVIWRKLANQLVSCSVHCSKKRNNYQSSTQWMRIILLWATEISGKNLFGPHCWWTSLEWSCTDDND